MFLAGLARENTKAFVVVLGAALRQRVSAGLRAEPRIGGSMFRIANDLRFSRDQPPYKPHLDFAFREGPSGARRWRPTASPSTTASGASTSTGPSPTCSRAAPS